MPQPSCSERLRMKISPAYVFRGDLVALHPPADPGSAKDVGAILVLRQHATLQARDRDQSGGTDAVRRYIQRHAPSWYAFARAMNCPLADGELFMVRGCYQASSGDAQKKAFPVGAKRPPMEPGVSSGLTTAPGPYAADVPMADAADDFDMSEPETSSGLSDDDADPSQSPNMAKFVVTTGPVRQASARRRTHEARFVCEICGTALTTKRNLEGDVASPS